jgi:hypothetical protein
MHARLFFAASVSLALAVAGCDGAPATPDAGCTPGTAGCACLEGSICQGGLVCDLGICQGVDAIEIEVTDVNARSCEVVVEESGGAEVLGVDFTSGTLGTHVHESPRTAVTFTRQTDTAFEAGSVQVRRTEGAGTLALRRARCFDRDGNVLSGEPLRLVQ